MDQILPKTLKKRSIRSRKKAQPKNSIFLEDEWIVHHSYLHFKICTVFVWQVKKFVSCVKCAVSVPDLKCALRRFNAILLTLILLYSAASPFHKNKFLNIGTYFFASDSTYVHDSLIFEQCTFKEPIFDFFLPLLLLHGSMLLRT